MAQPAVDFGVPRRGEERSRPFNRGPSMTTTGVTFAPVSFDDLPGWSQDDHAIAFQAFRKSGERVLAAANSGSSASKGEWHQALLRACASAQALAGRRLAAAAARVFFEAHFAPHRVLHKEPEGLLTGYYEPVLHGSRKLEGPYHIPIYRRPPELVNLVDESMRGAHGTTLTHARKTANGLQPFPTRSEIESGALKDRGLELLYLADPVDVFFMQVQGSGRIKLPDGTAVRVSYDGKNGHPYSSIGRHLVDTGQLPANEVSLDRLAQWLRADPDRARTVMWHNASYVFFRELEGKEAAGPLGVLNIPLTAGRSLAVDAGVHAIGTPIYVSAPALSHASRSGPFRRLMIAQDVGSAIIGPERGDIYFGSGRAAGRLAGSTKHTGNFFVLLPRGQAPALTSPPGPAARSGATKKASAKQ
jgi:membrane-bound lytic murein transglycosylase A